MGINPITLMVIRAMVSVDKSPIIQLRVATMRIGRARARPMKTPWKAEKVRF